MFWVYFLILKVINIPEELGIEFLWSCSPLTQIAKQIWNWHGMNKITCLINSLKQTYKLMHMEENWLARSEWGRVPANALQAAPHLSSFFLTSPFFFWFAIRTLSLKGIYLVITPSMHGVLWLVLTLGGQACLIIGHESAL